MRQKIIIALDTVRAKDAKLLIDRLKEASIFKIGLQAFLNYGEDLISYLHQNEKSLFLDLKVMSFLNRNLVLLETKKYTTL